MPQPSQRTREAEPPAATARLILIHCCMMFPAMSIQGGPYLQAALLCEKALQETDGVISVIRIVDRWTVSGPAEDMPQTAIQATMVLMFKSGFHRGPGRLTITPTSPRNAT